MSSNQPGAGGVALLGKAPQGPVDLTELTVLLHPADHVAIAKQTLLPRTVLRTAEGQITVDYLAYWTTYEQLAADPDADVAALAEHASGQALESGRQAIVDLRAQGRTVDFGPLEKHNTYGPAVIDAQTAYVADCHVADTRVLAANRAVERSDPPGGRLETIAVTLVRSADRWLVDSLQYYDLAPGETCSTGGPAPG